MLRRHVYPTFGDSQLSTILPSEVQAWVRMLEYVRQEGASGRHSRPETISVLHSVVSAVMRSAVRDRKIVANPCEGTRSAGDGPDGARSCH